MVHASHSAQVFLQLVALLLSLQEDKELLGKNKSQGSVGIGKAKIPLDVAIGLSMTIAVLNLIKTLVILKFEALSVDLTLWQYIKCALLLG
jgi:hypothetical protein